MSELIFDAKDVRRVVEHSLAAPDQRARVFSLDGDGQEGSAVTKPTAPAVLLCHDDGVYLMSNGMPGDPLDGEDTDQKYFRHYVAYAHGCNPQRDADWYDTAHDLVGGDDFAETLAWAAEIKQLIDAGMSRIVLHYDDEKVWLDYKI